MNQILCSRCVLDSSVQGITFDESGVCNYCLDAETNIARYRFTREDEAANLREMAVSIKKRKNGTYDSILGLSGGVDSSYVAHLAMEMGLNPLCVHFDNGWNSDIAVKNIRKIIDVTGFDLYTYVIDWPEFRDLQRAFLKASVIDIEMLTDHAIFASLFKLRKKHGIKTVLSGTNYVTEHGMPESWLWNKMDLRNIKAIQARFGDMRIQSFPTMNTFFWLLMRRFSLGGIYEEPLNVINYKKYEAMEVLKDKFEWEYYGGKHYESVFTKFYQAYILPVKFGIDKRKVHFSDLIRSGELKREQAVIDLGDALYDPEELRRDRTFVLKKLGFTNDEFDSIMGQPPLPHDFYPTDRTYIVPLVRMAKYIFGRRK